MGRHVRRNCKVANSDEGMEALMDYTLQRQATDQTQMIEKLKAQFTEEMKVQLDEALKAQREEMAAMTEMMQKLVLGGNNTTTARIVGTLNNGSMVSNQVDASCTTNNVQINIVGFDREDRIRISPDMVKVAFTENPQLIEYCRMTDEERTDADKAAPYVVATLVDLVRRAHKDPVYRNIYLSPNRSDQVMVCLDDEERDLPQRNTPQNWIVRALGESIRVLFDGAAGALHHIIVTEMERVLLPLTVQCAASWVPTLYRDNPDRFVREGKSAMTAHLQNMRPSA
jgi:hypothetical protein